MAGGHTTFAGQVLPGFDHLLDLIMEKLTTPVPAGTPKDLSQKMDESGIEDAKKTDVQELDLDDDKFDEHDIDLSDEDFKDIIHHGPTLMQGRTNG